MNQASPQAPERLRVLVVDDEPKIVDLMSTALRYDGYEVHAAPTAPCAGQVRESSPHADHARHRLPDIDGLEVSPAARRDRTCRSCSCRPATRRTGYLGLTTGGDDYVTKPFSPRSCWLAAAQSCAAGSG